MSDVAEKKDYLIVPPTDEKKRRQLLFKLSEYKGRMVSKESPWKMENPELAHGLHEGYRDACYKAYILDAVLNSEEPVSASKLADELIAKWGKDFNPQNFTIACGAVDKHCGNLPNVRFVQGHEGTGLPDENLPDREEPLL